MSSKKKTSKAKVEKPIQSKFAAFQEKLGNLDDSMDDIDKEEAKALQSSDKKKETNRILRKKDSLSDTDDLAPSVDYDIEESNHKGVQEFKIKPQVTKQEEEYFEDDFEESSEDSLQDK